MMPDRPPPGAVWPADYDDEVELPPGFDLAARVPHLREIFASPVVGDGVIGDTLLGVAVADEDAGVKKG